ncbi:MAG: recombinase family protein [Candidatus Schekmanbacteria bacterium]|nr:recombinase family protein [Candidatus Schekmanbacteria bacterium]
MIRNGNGHNGKRSNGQQNDQAKQAIRCGIYTRKSTEEGLDSDFNSLDAQRESAEAYIQSQKSEGWIALPDRYDDGGFSGGNMERPALGHLLEDIQAGKIDCVVVYKVDRLSRSLIDFSKIIDVLDKNNVSFVSVTQQFNTSNSMGRLTLNILLSFAQFEREIIAERTRDKMCAARRKGKWIGGYPMLGYDIDPKLKKQVVNPEEAACVREIFRLYTQHQSLTKVAQELNSHGWTTKSWISRNERQHHGKPFTKTNLHSLLTNVIYLGKIEHQGELYQGEHEAIIDEAVWIQVQQIMQGNSNNHGHEQRNKHNALLRGLLVCGSCGKSLNHTYTKRSYNLYRYYVCATAQKLGYKACATKSVSAKSIEDFVVQQIKKIGNSPAIIQATAKKLKDELTSQITSLENEANYLRKELTMLKRQAKKTSNGNGGEILDNTADRINLCEKRLSEINRQQLLLANAKIGEKELKKALGLFDPLWDVLYTQEQTRILNLLIEKVVYDGEKETVTINFHPLGIKALADEVNMKDKATTCTGNKS